MAYSRVPNGINGGINEVAAYMDTTINITDKNAQNINHSLKEELDEEPILMCLAPL